MGQILDHQQQAVWCVPSANHVSCIYVSQNRGLRIRVFVTLFHETPLYLKSCIDPIRGRGVFTKQQGFNNTSGLDLLCSNCSMKHKCGEGGREASTCGSVHSHTTVQNMVHLPSRPKSRPLSPLECTERIRREIQLTLTTSYVQ